MALQLNRTLLPHEVEKLVKEIFPTMTLTEYISLISSEPKTKRQFEESLDTKLTKDMVSRLKKDPIRIYPNQQQLETYLGFGYKPKTMRELGWALKTIDDLRARNTSWLEITGRMGSKKEIMHPIHQELFERMGNPERLARMLGNPNAPLNEGTLTQFYEGGPVVEGTGKVYPYPKQYAVRIPRSRRNRKTRRSTRASRKSRRNN
jgi:hypothetical protein